MLTFRFRGACARYSISAFLIVPSALAVAAYEPVDLLNRVLAYEALFRRYRMECASYAARIDHTGTLVEDGPVRHSVEWRDKHRFRLDFERTYESGLHETTVDVSDGEVFSTWLTSMKNSAGQATVMPVDKNTSLRFMTQFLCFFSRIDDLDPDDISIISQEGNTVSVHMSYGSPNHHYEATFQRSGDYLRLIEGQGHYTPPGEETQHGTKYLFHYGKDANGADLLYPTKIEQIYDALDLHSVYEIDEVDFEPTFTDDLFKHEFKEGTIVRDKTTGIITRWHKAGMSLSEIEKGIAQAANIEKENALEFAEEREKDLMQASEFLKHDVVAQRPSRSSHAWVFWGGAALLLLPLLCGTCLIAWMKRRGEHTQ